MTKHFMTFPRDVIMRLLPYRWIQRPRAMMIVGICLVLYSFTSIMTIVKYSKVQFHVDLSTTNIQQQQQQQQDIPSTLFSSWYLSKPMERQTSQSQSSHSNRPEFAACLLVMDDNHFLSEWIAYHYHTVNLRTLLIATDPGSLTSPHEVLQKWKGMIQMIEWTSDNDYMTQTEFWSAQETVKQYFRHMTPELIKHRARQRLFYYKCLQTLKQQQLQQNSNEPYWTLLIDTDEFIRINYKTIGEFNMTNTGTMRIPHIAEPGSVATLLQQVNQNDPANAALLGQSENGETPLTLLQSSPCIQVPRIRFVSIDDNTNITNRQQEQLLSHLPINSTDFLTLRYHVHTQSTDIKRNKISKAIIDLSRIPIEDIVEVDSIHLPLRAYCEQPRLHTKSTESLLVINHYMGNYEQYTYRENDARHGLIELLSQAENIPKNKRSNNQLRNRQQFMENQKLKHPQTDDDITDWIVGFWNESTSKQQQQQHYIDNDWKKRRQHLLQGIGQLDKKSWRTYEGDPARDRCALLFFGLPRAYKTMVLPSIIQNILIPNARHHCDVYVHFYQQYQEQAGRKNNGGTIDPNEIFMLEEAVQSVFKQYRPKHGSRTENGKMKPIVSFVHDTPEQFLEKRKQQLHKYHETTDRNGVPVYFPWKTHTYTNSSIDNIVRQWHSIEYVFKLMDYTSKQYNLTYSRIGMFRSDVMYMTPIDIASLDDRNNIMDTKNEYFVTAPFGLYPINDRSIYGPYDAVKIWATKRFVFLEEHAEKQLDPGYTMHSERFLNATIFPAMERLGYRNAINEDICFLRTRADESAIVSDCSLGGMTRNWYDGGIDKILENVERIVQKKCTPFQMGPMFKFVGCGEGIDYKSE